MRLHRCHQKIVYRFHNQGVKFLKEYSTNVTTAPQNAFVDRQGRIVACFDQHRLNDDQILVVLEKSSVDRLLKHLFKFLYLTDVKADPEPSWHVYWDLEPDIDDQLPEGSVVITQKVGRMILSRKSMNADVPEAEMTKFRVLHEIPWQDKDYKDEMILCLDDDSRISYLKGCFLGQEIIARVHYKGSPPSRLVVKRYKDCTPEQRKAMTSAVLDPQSGDKIGFVFDKTSASM